jgi:hypothetical protein
MGKLSARVRERGALSAADVAAMHALFDLYYEGGSRAVFERDLADKSHVIELHDAGELRGFSTLALFAIEHRGQPVRGIFSGDTIVHHENWGEQALARCFCQFAGSVKAQAPEVPLVWLLISKGHRTYRYLHLFARRYVPAIGVPTPPADAALLDALCSHRFGPAYDPLRGVVRLDAAVATRLRPQWCDPRENLRQQPEVGFFLERNPHFAQGEELACLCELEPANLRSFALRAFTQGLQP